MFKYLWKSISTKLLIVILGVILPFNILAISLSRMSINFAEEQARLSVNNILENHSIYLVSNMQAAVALLYDACYNEPIGKEVQKFQAGKCTENEKKEVLSMVQKKISTINGADGYFICDNGTNEILIWNGRNSYFDKIEAKKWINEKLVEGVGTDWILGEMNGTQILYFFSNDKKYGAWINIDKLLAEIKKGVSYEGMRISFNEELVERDHDDCINISVLVYDKYYINISISKDDVLGDKGKVLQLMQGMAFCALFLVPILYIIINHLLLLPLKAISDGHKKLREGDWNYRITEKAKTIEFEFSYESFNQMADQICFLKMKNYENELEYQKMELNNLQLQIRPHFLLNVFNLIYTLSERNENNAVQDIIIYLSDYFRYLFCSVKDLELFDKEQLLIEGYMKMVSVRYPDSVSIEYSYDPQIKFVRVPPLLLHNFVENVIKHVVKQGIMTNIKIEGVYEAKKVTFRILDDGYGMSQEKVRELNECMHQKESDGSHVGYYNSAKRLKYFYGDEADISICSVLGSGTCVTVYFPYNLEGTENGTINNK